MCYPWTPVRRKKNMEIFVNYNEWSRICIWPVNFDFFVHILGILQLQKNILVNRCQEEDSDTSASSFIQLVAAKTSFRFINRSLLCS